MVRAWTGPLASWRGLGMPSECERTDYPGCRQWKGEQYRRLVPQNMFNGTFSSSTCWFFEYRFESTCGLFDVCLFANSVASHKLAIVHAFFRPINYLYVYFCSCSRQSCHSSFDTGRWWCSYLVQF